MEMGPIVQCVGLTKSYGGKLALNQVYLNLERGKIIGLLGPNGSGKTAAKGLALRQNTKFPISRSALISMPA